MSDDLTLKQADELGNILIIFIGDGALSRVTDAQALKGGIIYTQVDTEGGPVYTPGVHLVNRTGVYALRLNEDDIELSSGRRIPGGLLDEIIDTTITQHAGLSFDESLSGVLDITIQSLQEDCWLPDNQNLTYEEAVEAVEMVKEPVRQFVNELSETYYKLRDKYVGTKSWELYRRKEDNDNHKDNPAWSSE